MTYGEVGKSAREKLTAGNCPTCGYRGFVIGPRGGAAQNVECGNVDCRARFNVTHFGGKIVMAQAIERESEGGSIWPNQPSRPDPH